MIYRPNLFPNILHTIERWKNWCSIHSIPLPYLINSEVFNSDLPKNIGFDASAEFPIHASRSFNQEKLRQITGEFNLYDSQRSFKCLTYESCVNAWSTNEKIALEQKLFKCVFPD